ncbi:MAG: AMP-binding protein, partial [Alphaproteobacteria bacterium]|nr:AMP-binding protein [Alphaproteobacteria bacterium]
MTSGNLYDHFDRVFAQVEPRPALVSASGETLRTFGALRAESARLANALAALGVAAGDRVTVQVEKSVAGVALFLAVLRAGAVYQPLNPAYTDAEVDYFIGDAAPSLIVGDPSRHKALRQIADRHGVTAVASLAADGTGSLADLAQRMESSHAVVPRASSDLAGLLYTSGTTGRSKGAMITHGNLQSNAESLVRLWRITA